MEAKTTTGQEIYQTKSFRSTLTVMWRIFLQMGDRVRHRVYHTRNGAPSSFIPIPWMRIVKKISLFLSVIDSTPPPPTSLSCPSLACKSYQRGGGDRSNDSNKTAAKFIVPDWGVKVDFGIRFSYRPARLHWLAGRYDNPMPASPIFPFQGLWIWPLASCSVVFKHARGRHVYRSTCNRSSYTSTIHKKVSIHPCHVVSLKSSSNFRIIYFEITLQANCVSIVM